MLKLVFGVVILPLIVGGAFYSLERSGFFNVDHIELIVQDTPDSPLYLQPLVKKLDQSLEAYRGLSLWNFDLPGMAQKISAENWIQDVILTRKFPSSIRITVQTKEVKLLFMDRLGKFFPIVDGGDFLDVVDARQAPDVPLLVGDIFIQKPELRKKSVQVFDELPTDGSFSRKSISEIRFDPKEGFWMTLIKDGMKVKVGEDQVSLKSARVSQVIDYMDAHQFQARVIDANLSKKVLVRLRKDP
jgi:cell division protein FtsQ